MTHTNSVNVEKIPQAQFTEAQIKDIFLAVANEVPDHEGQMDLSNVVRQWQGLCDQGLAETWAAKEGDRWVGLLGALFMIDFWDGKPAGMEIFWFVLPEHRSTGASTKLWAEFEAEAVKRGCKTLWAGSNRYTTPAHVGKFYQKHSFAPWGTTYRKVMK